MKKQILVCLTVLLLCFVFQPAYGKSLHSLVWGPENQELRMNLYIENADSNRTDVYKVGIRLTNVGTTPIVLVAQWYEEEEKGDYCEYLKRSVELISFPEAPQSTAQTAMRSERTSPQPTLEIKPGDTVAAEWVTARRYLKPQGYYNTAPTFPADGLYSIRARFLAVSKQGNRILLYSNDCQLAVGGSTMMPKFAMARIIKSDANEGKVILDIGSDQKIELNDKFKCSIFPYIYWDILITEVKETVCTGSVKIKSMTTENVKVPTFPEVGSKAVLVSAKDRH